MPRSRAKATGKGGQRLSFAGIPRDVMKTRKYATLSGWAVKLLCELAHDYRSYNNGDLSACFSDKKKQGWRSSGTLAKALDELLGVGFIQKTRQGGKHKPSLYALTWESIDECLDGQRRHKLDCPPTITPSGTWRDAE